MKTLPNATVIPAAAIQRASFGTFVYVVKPDSTVSIQRIARSGPTENDRVAVTSGLEPQAQVVLEGVDALHEGARVEIVPEAVPRDSRQPASGGAGGPGGRRGRGGRPRGRARADEHLTSVHPAAGGDLAADGGAAAVGA